MQLRPRQGPASSRQVFRAGKAKLKASRKLLARNSRACGFLSPEKVDELAPTFEGSVLSCQTSVSKDRTGTEKSTVCEAFSRPGSAQEGLRGKRRHIMLFDPHTRKRRAFKLFSEQELALGLEDKDLPPRKDLVCDDDVPTVNDQIKISAQKAFKDLREGIREYLADRSAVSNILKYREKGGN